MGHCGISGTFECTKEKLNQVINQKMEQAAYESGHSYSGRINMLDGPANSPERYMEYTKYMFRHDLQLEDCGKDEWKWLSADEKKRERRMLKLKAKYDIPNEITLLDIAKRGMGKKIPTWKKFILDYFWNDGCDVLYVIQVSARKFYWFGSARC